MTSASGITSVLSDAGSTVISACGGVVDVDVVGSLVAVSPAGSVDPAQPDRTNAKATRTATPRRLLVQPVITDPLSAVRTYLPHLDVP